MSAEEVAKAFVAHFYQTFDANAAALAGLYVSFNSLSVYVFLMHRAVRSIGQRQ